VPSTPHFSAHALVFVLSVAVTVGATWWAATARGFPGRPQRWPRTFLDRVAAGFRRRNRETVYWSVLGLYSAGVAVLHFGGMRLDVYTAVHWWDLLTHALGGIGVAALLHLTFAGRSGSPRPTGWLVPAVLAIGAGFEIYEFVFKDFWYAWPLRFYLVDTVVDLVFGAIGAAVVVVAVAAYRRVNAGSADQQPPIPENARDHS
jgi:hypothetical protein